MLLLVHEEVELLEDVDDPDEDFFNDFSFFEDDEEYEAVAEAEHDDDEGKELVLELTAGCLLDDVGVAEDDEEICEEEFLWLFEELDELVVRSLLCSFCFFEDPDNDVVDEEEFL